MSDAIQAIKREIYEGSCMLPGFRWRYLAWGRRSTKFSDTFTKKDGVCFDELVIDDWLHIEQMNDKDFWMKVGDAYINVTIAKDKVTTLIERGQYGDSVKP